MSERIEVVRRKIKRFNQAVLTFPVWIVIGVAGMLRWKRPQTGWIVSDDEIDMEKMY